MLDHPEYHELACDIVRSAGFAACLADNKQFDEPLLVVNEHFEALTGYENEDVVGRNCRFLQTSHTVETRNEAFEKTITQLGDSCHFLLNYTVDGAPFFNLLFLGKIEVDGKIDLTLGSQFKVDPVYLIKSHDVSDFDYKAELTKQAETLRALINENKTSIFKSYQMRHIALHNKLLVDLKNIELNKSMREMARQVQAIRRDAR